MNKKRRERGKKNVQFIFLDHLLYKTIAPFVSLFLKFLNVKRIEHHENLVGSICFFKKKLGVR